MKVDRLSIRKVSFFVCFFKSVGSGGFEGQRF